MRSKFETLVAASLKRHRVAFEYEPFNVKYSSRVASTYCQSCGSKDTRKNRNYRPDFVLGNGIYLEAKGKLTSAERSKIIAILETSDVINLDNYRLLFMRDNTLSKTSTTRYSEWATKHGIIFHVSSTGEVPKNWTL